jgi:hypothetical protein
VAEPVEKPVTYADLVGDPPRAFDAVTTALVVPEVADALVAAIEAGETPVEAAGPLTEAFWDAYDRYWRQKWGALPWVRRVLPGEVLAITGKTCTVAIAGIDEPVTGVLYGPNRPTLHDVYPVHFPVQLPPEGTRLAVGPVDDGPPWIKVPGGAYFYYQVLTAEGVGPGAKLTPSIYRLSWPPVADERPQLLLVGRNHQLLVGVDGLGQIWLAGAGQTLEAYGPAADPTAPWTRTASAVLGAGDNWLWIDPTPGQSGALVQRERYTTVRLQSHKHTTLIGDPPGQMIDFETTEQRVSFFDFVALVAGGRSDLASVQSYDTTTQRWSWSASEPGGTGHADGYQDTSGGDIYANPSGCFLWTWQAGELSSAAPGALALRLGMDANSEHRPVAPFGPPLEGPWFDGYPTLAPPPPPPPNVPALAIVSERTVRRIPQGLAPRNVSLMAAGPGGSDSVRLIAAWQDAAAAQTPLWGQSSDDGNTWTPFPAGLGTGGAFLQLLAWDRELSALLLRLGFADSPTYYSADAGQSWTPVPAGWQARDERQYRPAGFIRPAG